MFFSAVDFRYFIKPCKRSAIQPVSQRRDEREAISLGLAIPTNATAFSKHKIYFIIKVISLFAAAAAPTKFFLLLYRHSLIYAVNEENKKITEKKRVNRGYSIALKGRKIG